MPEKRTSAMTTNARPSNACVQREAVGPDVDVLIELHRRLEPMDAIHVAYQMKEFNPFWYEELVSARSLVALAKVRRAINIPVVAGEEIYTKAEFRHVFEKDAASILNPDVCKCGGILELKEIAAMAEPYFVAVSPHNDNSTTVGLAATVQACAAIPNFLMTKYLVDFTACGEEISINPILVENGYIQLPTAPGLGVELDEAALTQYPHRELSQRHFQQFN